jgi:Resolvase, N terminal domain
MAAPSLRPVALYARVSTHDQTCENQLLELRRYAEARGWQTVEYIDHAVSGSKDRRPALDQLTADVNAGDSTGSVGTSDISSCCSTNGRLAASRSSYSGPPGCHSRTLGRR